MRSSSTQPQFQICDLSQVLGHDLLRASRTPLSLSLRLPASLCLKDIAIPYFLVGEFRALAIALTDLASNGPETSELFFTR